MSDQNFELTEVFKTGLFLGTVEIGGVNGVTFSTFICIEGSPGLIEYLRKRNPDSRIILYLWNKHFNHSLISLSKELNFELWSFDENVCREYSFKYNPQFYPINVGLPTEKIKYDFFFAVMIWDA